MANREDFDNSLVKDIQQALEEEGISVNIPNIESVWIIKFIAYLIIPMRAEIKDLKTAVSLLQDENSPRS